MRNAVMVCLWLLMIYSPPLAQAFNEEVEPRYSLAFNTSQGVYIASFLSDNTWRIDALPRNVYFHSFDLMNCFPVWSSDGHRLFFMLDSRSSEAEDDYHILSQIGSYDVFTRTFQIHATLDDPEPLLSKWDPPELLAYSLETGETVVLFSEEGETVFNPLRIMSLPTLLWSLD